VPILTGKARLEGADLLAINSGFVASNFKVSLIGNNADWFSDVGNILVRDLGWSTIEVSETTVKANYNPVTAEYCFILMKWKAWENETYILYNELTPAIFIWQILEKAFANKGYQRPRYFLMFPFEPLKKNPQSFHQRKHRLAAEQPPKAQGCDKKQDKEGLIMCLDLSCNSSV